MFITLSLIGFIIVIFITGKINAIFKFRKQVKRLFSESKSVSNLKFSKEQIKNLPEPVKKYFNHILKEGQPYISFVRIKHDGLFKAGIEKDWMDIKGEQYATTGKPGFIWKGTTRWFTARDMFISGKGRLIVSLLDLIQILDGKGRTYDQGELLRWLGESILYPTNLLPNDRLKWFPIDDSTAELRFSYKGLSLFFTIRFNETGEITEMETKRYMDLKTLETWLIKVGNYKELNGIIIPTTFEVLWRLAKGDFSYAKFNITEIEYDKPELF